PKELFFSQSHTAQSTFSAQPADIPSAWAQDDVWAAICGKLVPNDLQGTYTANITREEFCRLMVALVEEKTGTALPAPAAPFTDTQSPAVAAAYAAGIVKGATETTFNPNGSITRQEAAVMLARTAGLLGLTAGAGETFADGGSVASWAADGVAFTSGLVDSTGAKVMGGTGDGAFSPLASYTREQAILTALRLSHCE
ncbi:MAG: S-layer homology domain-containing protein, partial [Oscillospiraceae bacterium]|nr:S-layer homology domain-containing protein [Oscillospiraceae bacterium]